MLIPYHAGILVPDIAAAMGDLSARFGYMFNEPVTMKPYEVDDRINGTTGPIEATVTYTRQGPFRLELIEFSGDGIYSSAHGAGPHHLGVWEPDIDARLAEVEASGAKIDAVFRGSDGAISVFYVSPDTAPGGTRIEYVSERQRARLERWFDTGVIDQPARPHDVSAG
ncbi:VOC family protein [Actinomadura physcomitrii]|uniref:VOC family protein n=1 Tax=Actinomadura physcomitrii TaxID=2650748 RepID=UPI001369CDFF|nr:VOC family protein [Actinomadura physcomitrii]